MIGQRVGRYRVLDRIGKGGMGEVYLAEDTSLDRKVALKFLVPALQMDEVAHKRFIREAKSSAALDHPYICSIHEVSQTDEGQDFIVMEYVEGETLRERLDQGEIPIKDALKISLEITEALQEAHNKGIIHRDLKPSNIMLTENGHAKVMDFGLAKRTQREGPQEITDVLTREGKALGTLPYMSPEQALGKPLDGRSDIFSFGIVLYELLTRTNPFHKRTRAATSYALLADHPSSLSDHRSDLPATLEYTLERMLAKDVEQRFQCMEDLAAALQAARKEHRLMLEGRTDTGFDVKRKDSHDRQAGFTAESQEELESRGSLKRWIWLASSCIVAVLLVGGGIWFWPQRCLWAPGWFDECAIPAYKHTGVLSFTSPGTEDSAITVGFRRYITDQLTTISKADSTVCVHPISYPRQATLCNLNLEAAITAEGETAHTSLMIRKPENGLLLRTLSLPTDMGSLQNNLAVSLGEIFKLELGAEAQRAVVRGTTGIPEAFLAYLRGLGHLKQKKLDEAISSFQEAIAEDHSYALAHVGLAEAYWRRSRVTSDSSWLDSALESCEEAIKFSAQAPFPLAYTVQGQIQHDLQQFETAIVSLEYALRLNPMNPSVRLSLADSCLALGAEESAENFIQAGVDLRPNCSFIHDEIGFFYLNKARFEDAEKHYRRVVEIAPHDSRGYHVLAGVQYQQEKWAESEQSFKAALKISPSVDTYLSLGQLYIRLDCVKSAIETLERATELGKDVYLAWGNKAEAYRLLPEYRSRAPGIFARAITLAQAELAKDPNNPQLLRMLGFYHARLGEKERALQLIESALQQDPSNIPTVYRAGYLYELVGERDPAVKAFTQAIAAGISTRELCDNEDLENLRQDRRIVKLLANRCTGPEADFVCAESRPDI